jgi:hypothetical protein
MLKITTQKNAGGTILELEGRLAGPWVQELERCWRRAVGMDQPVRVMLKAVTFIDDAGKKLLTRIHRQGTSLIAEGCMTKAIVAEIMSMPMMKKTKARILISAPRPAHKVVASHYYS